VATSTLEIPRRVTSGLDSARVGMVLAVLQRRADVKIGRHDVFAATVGGVRLTEPSVDLAVALAIASAAADLSVPGSVVAIGEVGLAGEVRRVPGVARRLAEAERMGFRRAIVPAAAAGLPSSGGTSRSSEAPNSGGRPGLHVVDGTRGAPAAGRTGNGRDAGHERSAGHGGLTDVREVEDVREAIAATLGG
jgi:DNA repair protein RadA/Sms